MSTSRVRLPFLLLLFVSSNFISAAHAECEFEKSIPKHIIEANPKFATFTLENDKFGDGADRNYTNGFRMTFYDYEREAPAFAHWIDDYVPTFETNDKTGVYLSFGQNMYTPENISVETPDTFDRPYAAFLYGSVGLSNITCNHIDDLEITLGIVGPTALGEPVQKFVHDILNTTDPKGWDHQLRNEPGVMLSWQRLWPMTPEQQWFQNLHLRVAPHIATTVGNVYTYGAAGLSVQLTPEQYKWQSIPLRVRPAIPGNNYFNVPRDEWAWSVFAGIEARAVAQNIFLDGNTFKSSPSVDKKTLVYDANAGVTVIFGKTSFSYTLNWRSKEFHGQNEDSLFGALSIARRFK
jgi:hypothetical protein